MGKLNFLLLEPESQALSLPDLESYKGSARFKLLLEEYGLPFFTISAVSKSCSSDSTAQGPAITVRLSLYFTPFTLITVPEDGSCDVPVGKEYPFDGPFHYFSSNCEEEKLFSVTRTVFPVSSSRK